ncbi:MAG TPA: TolC family protein [Gemmatales bacterium]|nr:TolC family protein [Gemmatales bacterium]
MLGCLSLMAAIQAEEPPVPPCDWPEFVRPTGQVLPPTPASWGGPLPPGQTTIERQPRPLPQPAFPQATILNKPIDLVRIEVERLGLPPAGILRPIIPMGPGGPEELPEQLAEPPQRRPDEKVPELPQEGALHLREVMESVEQTFPLLLAVELERDVAAGQRLTAEGAFDTNVRLRAVNVPEGTYQNYRLDAVAEQASPLLGASVFAGYRYGFGDFPVYYGNLATADGGEFRAGVQVPLLRGLPIDRARAALRQAQLGQELAEPEIIRARLLFFRAAARAYWHWVAAGEQYIIAVNLLRIATQRQAFLEEQFSIRAIAELPVRDNERVVFDRRGILALAEQRYQQAAYQLSLYLRDETGQAVVPNRARLPANFLALEPPAPATQALRRDVELALSLRPELARFQLQRERLGVDLRLAEDQLRPGLNLAMTGVADVGAAKAGLDRYGWEIALLCDVPLQRRDAQGRTQTVRAQLLRLAAEEQFMRDAIVAEVQSAVADLDRAFARLQQARAEQAMAERVLAFERERQRAGAVDILVINIRERDAFAALIKIVDALADFYRAEADYRAVLGLDTAVPVPSRPAPQP